MVAATRAFSLAVNLDHVGWWVDDLHSVTLEFERLGFNITRPASLLTGSSSDAPTDEGQVSSHIMFQNSYLELTTVVGEVIPHHLTEYQAGSGLKIIALGCVDACALHGSLVMGGWDVVDPARSERQLNYGDQLDEPVRFHWFMATPRQFPEVLVCLVEHLDHQRLFDAQVTKQPNQVAELTEVLMLSDEPEGSYMRYKPLESSTDDATGWLTFLTPEQAELAYPGARLPRLSTSGTDCTPMGVVLRSAGLDFLRGQLDQESDGEVWFAAPGRTIVVVREF
jgi:hypothetical protein